jgi:hypothetical protein
MTTSLITRTIRVDIATTKVEIEKAVLHGKSNGEWTLAV